VAAHANQELANDKRSDVDAGNKQPQQNMMTYLKNDHQQQQQHADDNVHHRAVATIGKQLQRGRPRGSSAGRSVRLSRHPDCIADVQKYCKRSSLQNVAVVDCLQDNVVVSNSG